MLSLRWGNNIVGVTESSTIRVTEQLIDSHLHMVKGAMRSTRQPMIIWVSEFDLEAFKRSPDVSKGFCERTDEEGKTLKRGFNFHVYCGRHFALSMSLQALEINRNTIFKEGSNPSVSTLVEVLSPPSQIAATSDISGVEKFNKGGVISTSTFTNV